MWRYRSSFFRIYQAKADEQDPEDRVFIESMDWSTIKPDPDVGAVLCGFDAYVSTYTCLLFRQKSGADMKTTRNIARHTPI